MKTKISQTILLSMIVLLTILSAGCARYAEEQGTVSVEVTQGKIVKVHEPGEWYTTLGPYTTGHEVDLRNHLDGVDIHGVTSDNVPFYMKINVAYSPMHVPNATPENDPLVQYLSKFGFDETQRANRRWSVLSQLVSNAGRDATSGKYDAYALRANQALILAAIKTELDAKFPTEMYCKVSSVGMDIQPQFTDPRIDDAANAVVAAKKNKEAEDALKAAAEVKIQRMNIENQQWTSSPQAFELEKLKWQAGMMRDFAQGIAQHQGTLILDPSAMRQLQLQSSLTSEGRK